MIRWFSLFKRGRTSLDDAERCGRSNEAVVPDNVTKVHKMVLADCKVKVQEIADSLKISKGSAHTIVHERLGMTKIFSKWVPRSLTPDQKQTRVFDSTRCLEIFNQYKGEFYRWYVTMDKTWLRYNTPEKRTYDESRPRRHKTQKTAGKVMAIVFWDAQGILLIDYLEHGKIIDKDYFMTLLVRLKEVIQKKRPHLVNQKLIFHLDNEQYQKLYKNIQQLYKSQFELLPRPPFSPDLAPSDYWLFADLKKMFSGRLCKSDDEAIAEAEAHFEAKDESYYMAGIEQLENRWKNCISCEGDYLDE